MQLVVDANVLLAALLRKSTTRDLIFDPRLELFAPEHLRNETEQHLQTADRFRKRLGVSPDELAILLSLLFSNVSVVPADSFKHAINKALKIAPHKEDAPYLALALALKVTLWSNDAGMRNQSVVKVVTTKELLSVLE